MPDEVLRRLGVLVPWANVAVESELPRYGERVTWHYARLVPRNRETELGSAFLDGLLDAAPDAIEQLSRLPLAAIYLACTSAGFATKYSGDDGHSGPRVVTAFDAIIETLERLDAHRIVLATPYPTHITETEVEAFSRHGFEVLAHESLDLLDDYGRIPPAKVTELVERVPRATLNHAQQIVLSCTGWHTRAILSSLSNHVGTGVLSSNSAIASHAQRLVGDLDSRTSQ